MSKKYDLNQLRGAWGAGRAQAVRDGIIDPLEGKYFHSKKDGTIDWQGKVLHPARDEHFLVQLYSWLDGRPTKQLLVAFEDMLDWDFYSNSEEWLYAAECLQRQEYIESQSCITPAAPDRAGPIVKKLPFGPPHPRGSSGNLSYPPGG